MSDSENVNKWVVLELSHVGEQKSPKDLKTLIQQEIGKEVEIFIPASTFSRWDNEVTICLMEGYFFVEAGLPNYRYFNLETTNYVKKVLTGQDSLAGDRYLTCVDNDMIEDLKSKLKKQTTKNIEEGDEVHIVEGSYSNLTGDIVDVFRDEEKATIRIKNLRSMSEIVKLPFQFFEMKPPEDNEE